MKREVKNKMFFSTVKNQNKLLDEIQRWVGTGFQYNCAGLAQPGLTADCVSFPLAVFRNLGLVPETFSVPQYVSVKGGRGEFAKLLACLDTISNLKLIWERETEKLPVKLLAFGDLIVCSSGSMVHHVLIYTGNGCAWHCWPKIGVVKTPIVSERITKHARRIYRFINAIDQ